MNKYEIESPYYAIFKDNEIIESSLCEDIQYDNHTFIFSSQKLKQIHIVYMLSQNTSMNIKYILEDDAHIDLIETRILEDNSQFNRDITLNQNSVLHLFNENSSKYSGNVDYNDHVSLYKDSSCLVGYGELSEGSLSASYHYDLLEEGANVKVRMAALSKGEDKKNYEVTIQHLNPHTYGQMDNYGVVLDKATLSIDGIGTITKGQYGSESHQTNKIIVFDENCYAQANPYLYIDEYDVKASHAAAVGKMDEEHLFYLQSRGLSKKASMKLITYGYLKPVCDIIDNEVLKERFLKILTKVGEDND
jgi:Fe-S cluster assembly protein SufD